MDSINSIKESLNVLEGNLEEGQFMHTNPTSDQAGINTSYEKAGPKKKREQKLLPKMRNESNQQRNSNLRDGPWNRLEVEYFLTAVRKFGKDWHKIAEHIGTRSRA